LINSINENHNNNFKVYPNPANNTITIQSNTEGDHTYEFKKLLGKVIKVGKVNNNNSVVDITSLPKGVYLLSVKQLNANKLSSEQIKVIVK